MELATSFMSFVPKMEGEFREEAEVGCLSDPMTITSKHIASKLKRTEGDPFQVSFLRKRI